MKHIEPLEAARGKEITFEELGVHRTFYWAYRNSREADTETLDFDNVIWEQDIPGIVESCRRFEINRFTISCAMSSMADTIWELQKHGCRLVGMTRVNGRFDNYRTGARETHAAFEIEILA